MNMAIVSIFVPVRRFIRHCEECQQSKQDLRRHDGPLQPIPMHSETWYRIGIDLKGALKTSKSGSCYIMTITDAYTNWPEATALPTKSARDVSGFLYSLLCRHGCPAEIVSDQGIEFVNQTVGHLNAYADTPHKITAAYHPKTNGLHECMNHTLMNALQKIDDAESEWESHVEAIPFAYRTSKHHSTGFTPFNLMYWRETRLPIDLAVISRPEATRQYPATNSSESRLQHLQRMKAEVKDIAEKNITKAQNRQKRGFDKGHSAPTMHVGQCNIVKNNRKLTRKGGKLEKTWSNRHIINEVLPKGRIQARRPRTIAVRLSHTMIRRTPFEKTLLLMLKLCDRVHPSLLQLEVT